MDKTRILVGSPVYQKPEILRAFLESLKNINRDTISIDYMFVDDNVDKESSQLLATFEREQSSVAILHGAKQDLYICNENTHYWNDTLMHKVGAYKNHIISHAIEKEYDYLFLVDSDLILHPNLIEHLKKANKDIVSEIFWSQWHNDRPLEPNVWLFDEYDLVPKQLGEKLTQEEMDTRSAEFINRLKIPGLYEVGGLGACTLISKAALIAGVDFRPIKNLTIPGEDRFFCIRAAVLGIELYVDTHYPAYHIYREKDLSGVEAYIKQNNPSIAFTRHCKDQNNKLTLSMIVKNEENRYLSQVLNSLKDHIDNAVIIDDGSTDGTVEICKKILSNIPLRIVENKQSMFSNEVTLRKKQWQETTAINPDWILNLDADELLEDRFWACKEQFLNNQEFDSYFFRLYDMWNETHYREDKYWNAHSIYRPFLLRYQPHFNYIWNEIPQHCGRFPANTFNFPKTTTEFRVKHLGWAAESDRSEKYKRYKRLDPDSAYGCEEQYNSILDINPKLVPWIE